MGELRGIFAPIIVGEAFKTLFSHKEAFGPYNIKEYYETGKISEYLMDKLPLASQGYALRNTISLLLYIFVHYNRLQNYDDQSTLKVDDNPYIQEAFNGEIPATWYVNKNTNKKILMKYYVDQGYDPLNTFQLLTINFPYGTVDVRGNDVSFNSKRMRTYYLQNIVNYNTTYFQDPELQRQLSERLKAEHDIITNFKDQYKADIDKFYDKNIILNLTPEEINNINDNLNVIYDFIINNGNYDDALNSFNHLKTIIPKMNINKKFSEYFDNKPINERRKKLFIKQYQDLLNEMGKIYYTPENLKSRGFLLNEEQKEELEYIGPSIVLQPGGTNVQNYYQESQWVQDQPMSMVQNVNQAYRSIYNICNDEIIPHHELQYLLRELEIEFPENTSDTQICNYLKNYYQQILS